MRYREQDTSEPLDVEAIRRKEEAKSIRRFFGFGAAGSRTSDSVEAEAATEEGKRSSSPKASALVGRKRSRGRDSARTPFDSDAKISPIAAAAAAAGNRAVVSLLEGSSEEDEDKKEDEDEERGGGTSTSGSADAGGPGSSRSGSGSGPGSGPGSGSTKSPAEKAPKGWTRIFQPATGSKSRRVLWPCDHLVSSYHNMVLMMRAEALEQ